MAGMLLALLAFRPVVCQGAADDDFFAIHTGAYPMLRWAEEAAARYQRQGLFTFVAPSSTTGENPRSQVYVGRFKAEAEADDQARMLKEHGIVSHASRVQRIDGVRHQKMIADRDFPPDPKALRTRKEVKDGRFTATRGDKPDPAAMHKPGDLSHLQLIRSILGGIAPTEAMVATTAPARPADVTFPFTPRETDPAAPPASPAIPDTPAVSSAPAPSAVTAADFESDFITTPES
jgi:hypothetical protein